MNVCVCMRVCMCVCIYIYIHTHACVYIYIYIYVHKQLYTIPYHIILLYILDLYLDIVYCTTHN